ncbi:MAG: PIG-L deacetylase family protein [Promethearchaeota archaeon]
MRQNILIFEAHSDDCVIGMGGTAIKLSKTYDLILVTMTKGETAYTKVEDKEIIADVRKEESLKADKILGIKEHLFLQNPCQDLQNNLSNYHTIVKIIRKYKPIRIYTHKSPSKHRDHIATHDLITEGWWKASENVLADYGKPFRCPELYYFEVTDLFEFPSIIVDISDVFDAKIKALESFSSQFEVLKGLKDFVKGLAMVRGYMGGVQYGEAFTISNFLPKLISIE